MESLVRPAVPEDLDLILPQVDFSSVRERFPKDPKSLILEAIESPTQRVYTGILESPVCLVGFSRETLLSEDETIWFLPTVELQRRYITLCRQWRWYVEQLATGPLIAEIDPEDKRAMRWAMWMGFSIDSVVKSGLYRMRMNVCL